MTSYRKVAFDVLPSYRPSKNSLEWEALKFLTDQWRPVGNDPHRADTLGQRFHSLYQMGLAEMRSVQSLHVKDDGTEEWRHDFYEFRRNQTLVGKSINRLPKWRGLKQDKLWEAS